MSHLNKKKFKLLADELYQKALEESTPEINFTKRYLSTFAYRLLACLEPDQGVEATMQHDMECPKLHGKECDCTPKPDESEEKSDAIIKELKANELDEAKTSRLEEIRAYLNDEDDGSKLRDVNSDISYLLDKLDIAIRVLETIAKAPECAEEVEWPEIDRVVFIQLVRQALKDIKDA